jgi:hypothetical protein
MIKFFATNLQQKTLKHLINKLLRVFIVAPLGLEPRHTEPKSAVLPIRRWGIVIGSAKLIQLRFLTIS